MKVKFVIGASLIATVLIGCAVMPSAQTSENIVWLEQGWSDKDRDKYHYLSQGTMTLPIPYEWFSSLEQPGLSHMLVIDNGYLSRLGFISGEISKYNQAGLPVGFSVDYGVENPAISRKRFNSIGLTCAACHTGQMIVNGVNIRYDGGPAMSDLTQLTTVLGLALIETYLNPVKFDRFAKRILGVTDTDANRKELRKELRHTLSNLIKTQFKASAQQNAQLDTLEADEDDEDVKKRLGDFKAAIENDSDVKEGFTRVDALNRIGNAVFGSDMGNNSNVAAITAPVNYPQIWDSPWFLWVQYDASIMGPMIRNAGEAMGVGAYVKLNEKDGANNFDSSIPVGSLHWMEQLLAGKTQPQEAKRFTGLQSPRWREDIMGKIDPEKYGKGAKLYGELCQGCHLPPIDSKDFWASPAWTKPDVHNRSYLDLPVVSVSYIGTDPAQANVLQKRTVDNRGSGIGGTQLYLEDASHWYDNGRSVHEGGYDYEAACKKITLDSSKISPFATSLGAAVQNVTNYWYDAHHTPEGERVAMNGYRENCLRAPNGYKARPLNGIWATAPYLHNGSVPTLFDLLSPVSERPKTFYLGSLQYDTQKLGYDTIKQPGYFLMDTSIPGNLNSGHEFSDTKGKGVIGRGLTVEERYQLIEYLKDVREVAPDKSVSGS